MLTAPQSHDPWLTFGPESPFGRLLTADGWICLLGVTHRSSTFLHAVEEQNCLDYFVWPEPLTARVLRDGEVQHIRTSVGRPGVRRAFDQIEPLLLAEHALIVGKVGAATVRLMRARAVMTIATAALRQRPHLLAGGTMGSSTEVIPQSLAQPTPIPSTTTWPAITSTSRPMARTERFLPA